MNHIPLSLFHVLLVAPFFIYIAYVRGQVEPWIYTVLLVLGSVILLYHTYKIIIKWRVRSPTVWVNAVHVVAVAPLLLYIGSCGYDTPRWAYEVLAMLGFSAIGYHLYSILLSVQEMNDKTAAAKKMIGGFYDE